MKYAILLIIILFTKVSKSQTFNKDSDILIKAIAMVESKNGKIMIGEDTTCVGLLQIKRELVDEVNRIIKIKHLKYKYFKYNDRLNNTKSIEMYYIYQQFWNPNYEFKRACNIWCSGLLNKETKGRIIYRNKVITEIMKLVETHCSESHKNMIRQYINGVKNVKHKVIQVTTKEIRTNMLLNDSKDILEIVINPNVCNIPKNFGNVLQNMI
jgi:hypothetical protein